MVKHGISSAPVYNSKTNTYVGMLDYRDIVDYVLIVFNKKKLPPIQEDEVWGILEIMEKVDTGEPLSAQSVSGIEEALFLNYLP